MVAAAITTDGAEAIIVDGIIIIVGERRDIASLIVEVAA